MEKMNNKNTLFRFVDLFCGIGGFRIALESLGGKCVFSCDNDLKCQQTYERNFGDTPVGDIKQINANSIPDFDILCAGFPCQPFSYAGEKKGFQDETRGTLFFDLVRILKEKKPKMLFLENVKGLKSHDNGKTLKVINNCLHNLGYTVYEAIINSHDFGVPQNRERWYAVGFLDSISFTWPKPINPNTTLKDIVDINLNDPSLYLTKFELGRIAEHFQSNQIRVKHSNSKYKPTSKKGKWGVYSYFKPDGTLRFHVGDSAKTQIQEAYYCSIHSVAPAIIATRCPKLWDLKRYLSVNECRKLQGFPDWFIPNESNQTAKHQFGNSVAIPVITAIAKAMLSAYFLHKALPFKQKIIICYHYVKKEEVTYTLEQF
jgi:DNA (cytosine-5)-methyltransferase 1